MIYIEGREPSIQRWNTACQFIFNESTIPGYRLTLDGSYQMAMQLTATDRLISTDHKQPANCP